MKITVSKCITLHIKSDHLVHIIKTGFTRPQLYHVIVEIPYDYDTPTSLVVIEDICSTFKITAEEIINKFNE